MHLSLVYLQVRVVRIVPKSLNMKQMALRYEDFSKWVEFRLETKTAKRVGKKTFLERYRVEKVLSYLRDRSSFVLLEWKV